MATTFAFPNAHSHGAGHHGHSHSRKSASQRLPLHPMSFNGGHQVNGGPGYTDLLKPPTAPQHKHSTTADIRLESEERKLDEFPQLATPPPSFSTPTSARTKSMERRKSAGLPTHLQLQGKGYGFPASTTQRFRSNTIEPGTRVPWITKAEVLSSIMVPLPYVLASYSTGHPVYQNTTKDAQGVYETSDGPVFASPTIWAVTSMTLMLMGCWGIFGTVNTNETTSQVEGEGQISGQVGTRSKLVRGVVRRLLTVGLPFYATSNLGAARVALIMLIGLASNIIAIEDEATDLTRIKTWRLLFTHRRWTMCSIILQLVCDLSGLTSSSSTSAIAFGYLALGLSALLLSPPYPSSRPKVSVDSTAETSFRTPEHKVASPQTSSVSPLVLSPKESQLTLLTGISFGVFSIIIIILKGSNRTHFSPTQLGWSFLTSLAAAAALILTAPKSLRSSKRLGMVLGSLLASFTLAHLDINLWRFLAYQSVLIGISFAFTNLDTHAALSTFSHSTIQHHHHTSTSHTTENAKMSKFSEFVLRNVPNNQLLHSILVEKDSRRIFYFMCLNFLFMIVQTFYGLATGSLGLLSDSIHMFFDCIALVVGLCAAVMSKWPPSTRFPYGYGKMDTLAGFANGIFLMLISIEIIYEAIERLAEGNRINKLGELLTVSTLGLVVNIVGLTAFGHAHHGHSHGGHSHGGHSHGEHSHAEHDHASHSHIGHHHENQHCHLEPSPHDHSHHDHGHHKSHKHDQPPLSAHAYLGHLHDHSTCLTPSTASMYSVPATPSKPLHSHSHAHSHGSHGHSHGHHDHGNENMQGIFLHVLADALGSVAVVISTILIHFYGWSGFDPLASCFIAIAIFASAVPLVTSSARTLLLTVPADTEYDLREALAGLSGLRGVTGYAVPKFWLEEGGSRKVLGVVHVIAGKMADMEDVKERVSAFLKSRNMDVVLQVEREGNDRCWCRAQK